jgi:hypothetical protein
MRRPGLSKVLKPLSSRRESAHDGPVDKRLYRRTPAGTAAWQRQDDRVPLDYRRILGVIEGDTHPDSLRARLARFAPADLPHLLDELVEQGLLEAVEAGEQHDLDFTGNFNLADLRKAGL